MSLRGELKKRQIALDKGVFTFSQSTRRRKKNRSGFKDRQAVADKADMEGLEYFLTRYTSADEMPDDELYDAFVLAAAALSHFESLLPTSEGEDGDLDG